MCASYYWAQLIETSHGLNFTHMHTGGQADETNSKESLKPCEHVCVWSIGLLPVHYEAYWRRTEYDRLMRMQQSCMHIQKTDKKTNNIVNKFSC